MFQKKKNCPLKVMEYSDWIRTQKFQNPEEHHKYVSYQEQDFLQYVVYPMFYNQRETQFKTSFPFPMVLTDYSSKKPIYVVDNNYFTIVFFSYDNFDDEMCWEVSVHIKDNDFCFERINEFKRWYREHYNRLFSQMETMPKEFVYPALKLYDIKVQDFCIEFWNQGRDFMLFKLLDLLRLF